MELNKKPVPIIQYIGGICYVPKATGYLIFTKTLQFCVAVSLQLCFFLDQYIIIVYSSVQYLFYINIKQNEFVQIGRAFYLTKRKETKRSPFNINSI